MFLLDRILPFIFVYIRPFIKWFLHTFTRLCELQRLCYGAQAGSSRTKQVERSLELSKNPDIQQLLRDLNEAVEFCSHEELHQFPARAVSVISKVKRIKLRIHPDFGPLLGECILQAWSYKHLAAVVERLRAESYDSDNLEHEAKLLKLWQLLCPNQPLSGRLSRQWQEIGFQGDDPKTDFRGMGVLGLDNLVFFAQEYSVAAQHVLLHSMHPVFGYTFAIVGINLTSLAHRLLMSGAAKTHFYNLAQQKKRALVLEDFHRFYCYLLFEFDRFWIESEPRDIMDFREIYQSFEFTILESLSKQDTIFKTNLVVEQV